MILVNSIVNFGEQTSELLRITTFEKVLMVSIFSTLASMRMQSTNQKFTLCRYYHYIMR